MSVEEVVRSTCGLCRFCCGVLLYLENGKVIRIEGDPECPTNRGEICIRGLASTEFLNSPERLKHPLKRIGERGGGKWQKISWDEALDSIAAELTKFKEKYGAESVMVSRPAAKGLPDDYFGRFANALGTPNTLITGNVCYLPIAHAARMTYGLPVPFIDYEYPPACILVWGANVKNTAAPEYSDTMRALDKGTKLIVIDPRQIELTARADIWLQLRPGSDLALALGMLNVIINEGLFDKAFVDKWTVGFDELKAHVQDWPPQKVEELTWIEAEHIRTVARFYAKNKPAGIQWGNGIEHNVNSFQTGRAIWILAAITGNLGVPGGEIYLTSSAIIPRGSPEFTLAGKIPPEKRNQRVSAKDGLLPFVVINPIQSIVKAILDEEPYPIRAAYLQGANLLLNYPNAQETLKALKKLEFIAVAELFMTPVACLADIVLPVASYLEYDAISAAHNHPVPQIQQKVGEVGESWSDYKILAELAKKLGLGEYFWDNEEQFGDFILKPCGITFKELKRLGTFQSSRRYRHYEKDGFATPSGKVELYSSQLKKWGFDPLPVYYEPPETPYSEPDLVKEYPLIYSSYKPAAYLHSDGRQIPSLRANFPDPVIEINPKTASKLGIKEGDWVYIETKRGRITQKARLSAGIDPRVVFITPAWWYPERGESTLFDWAKSNVNILTNNKPPYNREMGTTNLSGVLCKVYKAP